MTAGTPTERRSRRAPAPRREIRGTITLTGRGGVVVIFVLTLAGALLSAAVRMGPVPGILFVAGCAVAALMVRPADQLVLAVAPPAVFFVATLLSQVVAALGGSFVREMLAGTALAMAARAPWLFAGTVLTIAIGCFRGLPACVRALRTGDDPPVVAARPKARRARHGTSRRGARGTRQDEFAEDPVRWDVQP